MIKNSFNMNIRVYLVLLLAGTLGSGIIKAQWNVEKSPTERNLNSVCFCNRNSGWIVGDNGTILRKATGGWSMYKSPTTKDLYSVYMIDENEGWAVGESGTILHFDGINWGVVDSPTDKNLLSVRFQDSKNGISVGRLGTIILFKDGKWSLSDTKIRGDLFSSYYINNEAWFGGGLECVAVPLVKLSMTKGGNEPNSTLNSYTSIHGLTFIKPDDGWAVGSPSVIMHYNGLSWEKVDISERFSSLKSVFFSDGNTGISVGYNGTILIYSDYVWNKEKSNVIKNLNSAAITGDKYYAVGDGGTILVRNLNTNEDLTATEQLPSDIQLYPNPCDDFLKIVFPTESMNSSGIITVTNNFGQIFLKKSFKLENNNYIYQIATKSLKEGLYVLKINAGGRTTINKFIVSH
jgi:photosystem II stability/assembly factor-like uncharacterized protein